MEMVSHDVLIGPLMVPGEVHQSDIFNIKVIPLLDQLPVLLVSFQPLLKSPAQFLIKLIQLQEDTHVLFIQGKGLFHLPPCPFGVSAFVIVSQ